MSDRLIPSAALLALVAASACVPALAADADLLADAPEVVLQETRSGLYLRGDLGYGIGTDLDGTRVASAPVGPLASPLGARLDDAFGIGAGVGYRFSSLLRGDATLRYDEPALDVLPFVGTGCGGLCAGFEGGRVSTLELMANGYVDLGTVMGFTPYLGAGLGAVRVDTGDVGLALCGTTGCGAQVLTGSSDWRFAYALNAGVSYDLNEAWTLDAGYRFTDVDGGDAWQAASLLGPAFAVRDDGFERHAISLGLRFDLP